ncbi:MAG: CPBP family intramembrane glutamic endopeptidase [Chloroflexota bacterium]
MNDHTHWRTILWIGLPTYLIANTYLLFLGEFSGVMLLFANAIYLAFLALLTAKVSKPQPVDEPAAIENKTMLWIQVGMILVILLLTSLGDVYIPLWSDMVAWFHNLGEAVLPVAWFGSGGNSIANPVQYFVIPLVLMLLLGAKPAQFGLGKGHKVWQVCLVWLALPLLIWIGLLATGSLAPQTLVRRLIGNAFQNGFFEEFLFRGALYTRLRSLLPLPWALTIQAVLFGLWHLRANTQSMDGNILAGLAICVASQTIAGFVYGYVLQRTRNLAAPSVAHVVMNVLGQSFI